MANKLLVNTWTPPASPTASPTISPRSIQIDNIEKVPIMTSPIEKCRSIYDNIKECMNNEEYIKRIKKAYRIIVKSEVKGFKKYKYIGLIFMAIAGIFMFMKIIPSFNLKTYTDEEKEEAKRQSFWAIFFNIIGTSLVGYYLWKVNENSKGIVLKNVFVVVCYIGLAIMLIVSRGINAFTNL